MMYAEKRKFIDEELKQLWPQWKWTEASLKVWFGILNDYPYDEACTAIGIIYANDEVSYQRSLVSRFIKKAKTLYKKPAVAATDETKKELPLYTIQSRDRDELRYRFFLFNRKDMPSGDRIMGQANVMLKRVTEARGGEWYVVRDYLSKAVPF